MKAHSLGMRVGRFFGNLRMEILWRMPKLRKKLSDEDKYIDKYWLENFLAGFRSQASTKFVICESCSAVGFDYKSEEHGWHYHGYHYWSCPKCRSKK